MTLRASASDVARSPSQPKSSESAATSLSFRTLAENDKSPFDARFAHLKPNSTLADLAYHDFRVRGDTPGFLVGVELDRRIDLPGVMVERETGQTGLISRQTFYSQLSRPFAREIYIRRPIQLLLDAIAATPLRLAHTCSIADAAHEALSRKAEWVYEPLLVESPEGVCRMLDIHSLLLAQTALLGQAGRLQEQMQQASKMEVVGQLAGGVAHDFNNLLTVILGSLSLLKASPASEQERQELLNHADEAASRAANLTNQLLGFSRRKAIRLEPTDLNECIHRTVSLLRRTIDPGIEISVETQPRVWTVDADPGQIGQVLMNLFINARDAMPNGGFLRLRAANARVDEKQAEGNLEARVGEFVRVQVEDSGTGIAPELLTHIFEPFFTTKDVGKGTGLGLAMTYSIMQQHRGWVECFSQVGRGTRFDLYLPRCPQKVAPSINVRSPEALIPGAETLLLVDDEEMIRNIGSLLLRQHGYQVLVAKDGLDAVEMYERERGHIDLVILDLLMPRLSGREALVRLRQIDPKVRVLFSSGYTPDTVAETPGERVLGFISKPYRPQALAEKVREALDYTFAN